MKTILVTGGAGFAGHHLVEHILKNTDWNVVVIDKLSYASNGFARLRDTNSYSDKRVHSLACPLDKLNELGIIKEIGEVNYIVHMAAETHVDNSIVDPYPFVVSNVLGTYHILEFAKKQANLEKLVYFSTDEVFGPASQRPLTPVPNNGFDLCKHFMYREWDRYNSTNPYSATKAAGEELTLAWSNTYKLPVIITHTMNLYGERQHPEKFVPKIIKKVLSGELLEIHGTPDRTQSGSRFYIHCRNMADAILFLLNNVKSDGVIRDKFNIVGEKEVSNLTLAQTIADYLGKPLNYEIVDFHSSRPGHDLRYALNGTKLASLGWKHPLSFEESLLKTVKWVVAPENAKWLNL